MQEWPKLAAPYRVLFIINPGAGMRQAIAIRELVEELIGSDHPHRLVLTQRRGDATRLAAMAAKEHFDRVVAVGGDGTVMETFNGLVGSEVPLAVVPAGTSNVFAGELGIPPDMRAAVALALGPAACERIDLGRAGDRYFAECLATGLEARIVWTARRELKNRWGLLAYLVAGVKALTTNVLGGYRVAVDDRVYRRRLADVLVANMSNFGLPGVPLHPDISPTDGQLNVLLLRLHSIPEVLRLARDILLRRPTPPELMEMIPVRHTVEIWARPKRRVAADGELIGRTPVRVRVIPSALPVIVPAAISIEENETTPAEADQAPG